MRSLSQIVFMISTWWKQLIESVIFIRQFSFKQRVIGFFKLFGDVYHVFSAITKSLTPPDEGVHSSTISGAAEPSPGWTAVRQLRHHRSLKNLVEGRCWHSVRLQHSECIERLGTGYDDWRHMVVSWQPIVDDNAEYCEFTHSFDVHDRWRQLWKNACSSDTRSCDQKLHWLRLVKSKIVFDGPVHYTVEFSLTGAWIDAGYYEVSIVSELEKLVFCLDRSQIWGVDNVRGWANCRSLNNACHNVC